MSGGDGSTSTPPTPIGSTASPVPPISPFLTPAAAAAGIRCVFVCLCINSICKFMSVVCDGVFDRVCEIIDNNCYV